MFEIALGPIAPISSLALQSDYEPMAGTTGAHLSTDGFGRMLALRSISTLAEP